MEFKVGDRVKCIKDCMHRKYNGAVGTVRAVESNNTRYLVDYDFIGQDWENIAHGDILELIRSIIPEGTITSVGHFQIGSRVRSRQKGLEYTGTIKEFRKSHFDDDQIAQVCRDGKGSDDLFSCKIVGNNIATAHGMWDNASFLELIDDRIDWDNVESDIEDKILKSAVVEGYKNLKNNSEVTKMKLEEVNKKNLVEAKKQFETENSNAEIEFAKRELRRLTDIKQSIERDYDALDAKYEAVLSELLVFEGK